MKSPKRLLPNNGICLQEHDIKRDLKPFAFDVTQTALLLFSPSPGGRVRALGRSRNARQSVLRQIKRKTL